MRALAHPCKHVQLMSRLEPRLTQLWAPLLKRKWTPQ